MNSPVEVELSEGDAVVITGGCRFHVVTRDRAGEKAACPVHLLESSLGACIALTLDAVAKHKNIDIKGLKVRLERRQEEDGTRFSVYIQNPDNSLTERERKILYRCAQLCEVGKILKSNISIDYHFDAIVSGNKS